MSLRGIDISEYQAVGTQGRDFTIMRATYGTGYVDPLCDQHYQNAIAQGKKRGVYHVCYNRLNSAVDEANWFVDNIQGYIGDALLMLDNEKWVSKANNALLNDPTDVGWMRTFLDQVFTRTGVRPVIYMSAYLLTAVDWSPVASDYALVCAGYPARFDVANPPEPADDGSDMPYNTGAWPFATIWQYSSSNGTLDRDIAYMDNSAWDRFAARALPQPAPDPIPAPEPTTTTSTTQVPQPDPITTTTTTQVPTATTTSTTTVRPTSKSWLGAVLEVLVGLWKAFTSFSNKEK